jgi:hypothetical protein
VGVGCGGRGDGVAAGGDGTLKNPAHDHRTYYYESIVKVKKNMKRIEGKGDPSAPLGTSRGRSRAREKRG